MEKPPPLRAVDETNETMKKKSQEKETDGQETQESPPGRIEIRKCLVRIPPISKS
jgi:hypothetical protein